MGVPGKIYYEHILKCLYVYTHTYTGMVDEDSAGNTRGTRTMSRNKASSSMGGKGGRGSVTVAKEKEEETVRYRSLLPY